MQSKRPIQVNLTIRPTVSISAAKLDSPSKTQIEKALRVVLGKDNEGSPPSEGGRKFKAARP